MTAVGAAFAIVFGKQLYGGIGYNPFNPAMVGYVVLLVSFPVEMTTWAAPRALAEPALPGLVESVALIFGGVPAPDGVTSATPLDAFRHREGLTAAEWQAASPLDGRVGGRGWEWVNLGFLAGGLYLLRRGVFTWHAPGAMLATLALGAALFWDGGSSASHGSPAHHLFSGAAMLGAFFIVTDPVSGATSARGRLVFGAGVGALTFTIRAIGNYPDALAFSVLLMNMAAPAIDHFTRPRAFGHPRGATGPRR